MNAPEQWHYTDSSGNAHGPVSKDELVHLIATRAVTQQNLAWKEGMVDWMPIAKVPELEQPKAPTTSVNPYAPPTAAKTLPESPVLEVLAEYGGVGRLSYFLQTIGYVFALIAVMLVVSVLNSLIIGIVVMVVFLVLIIRLHCLRFQNMGMSGWWVLTLLLPIISYFSYTLLFAGPKGYRDTKKLDTPGIIIAVLMIGLFVLSFFENSTSNALARAMRELFGS